MTFKEMLGEAFSIKRDTASRAEIRRRLRASGEVTGTNLIMMVCANVIACVGLNAGSTTIVIGAMLIEPLMGSILMIAYSAVAADRHFLKLYGLGFLFQIMASVLAASVYFLLSPFKEPTEEILALTQPTLLDIIVALVGGVAGAIGQTRKEKANTIIPGVAIATSLMPPLCVCGYAIANRSLVMLWGAAYLFFVNAYFIGLGASAVLSLFKIPMAETVTEEERKKTIRVMLRNTLLISIPAVIATLVRLFG